MPNSIIFDLDDTLYKEIDYVKSGFNCVATYVSNTSQLLKDDLLESLLSFFDSGENAFAKLIEAYNLSCSIDDMLKQYRSHIPIINFDDKTKSILEILKSRNEFNGLLTDGRSIQQRNKIQSLGLDDYFSDIVISEEFGSEKPAIENYLYFMDKSNKNNTKYYYIGDNPSKDFISANKLGWITICLKDNGQNIHKQNFSLRKEFIPDHIINNIEDILEIIDEK
jgi:haloacid dehalogenase superfamily, subfamily IA, variant 1 with third motif having Dx(3-4)D or Dx(3-4)E